MSSNPKKAPRIERMLANPGVAFKIKKQLLTQLCHSDSEDAEHALKVVVDSVSSAQGENTYREQAAELAQTLQAMRDGPLRSSTFLRYADGDRPRRAEVVLPDGTVAVVVVPDETVNGNLRVGDTALLDAQATALLARQDDRPIVGERARFEGTVDAATVQVELTHQGQVVIHAGHELLAQLERGEIGDGDWVVVCPQRRIAFAGLPDRSSRRYRFLVDEPVPEVSVQRDVADPPAYIADLREHVRTEMREPALGRRYGLRRSKLVLLSGVSGSGKTFSIRAFTRVMYEVISEVTGVPIDRLPQRVLRLRASQTLSKWFGEAERNVDRFFDEVERLADEKFVGPDGREHELPVLVIAEEIDGLARARGGDGVHDRVQTTLLQRLDPNAPALADRMVLVVCTTNVASLVDPAFIRRAGGRIERFGRLGRRAFRAVLEKQVQALPFRGERRAAIDDVTAYLFGPNADEGQVELGYAGSATPARKYRRDFLTGALCDRAVQQAAATACRDERDGHESGITASTLIRAFDDQVRSIVDQLDEHNAHRYVDVPDGTRVASVRRLDRPAVRTVDIIEDSSIVRAGT